MINPKLYILILVVFLFSGSCKLHKAFQNPDQQKPEEALNWKLGAQAFTFNKFTFTEALNKIDSCELSYVEAFSGQEIGGGMQGKIDYKMSAANRQYIKDILRKKNIKLFAFGVIKAKDENEWRETFAFAKDMGISTITCEPDLAEIPLISSLCEEYKINAAIHNHPNPSFYWNPETVLKAIEGKSKRLGACADIGHWVRSGLDPIVCLKQLEGHVYQLHLKDLNVKNDIKAHDVHWGTGVSNIPGVIAELKRQNFKGMISAEYEYNWNNNAQDVRISVQNFRKILTD